MGEHQQAQARVDVTMKAVKLDRDGNVVGEIPFDGVESNVEPGTLEMMRREALRGWREGRNQRKGAE